MSPSQRTTAPAATELSISGMTCSSCVNAVTRTLSRVPGVARVQVDLDAGQARVVGNAGPEVLVSAIEKAGYGARLVQSENSAEKSHGRDGCC